MEANSRTALLRNRVSDYLLVNGKYELMGVGFTKLDESPNAQSESTTYINETTSSSDITGYETEFPYESDMIPSQKAVIALWRVGRDHLTGDNARFKYVRVDLYNPVVGEGAVEGVKEYTARLFEVANEVSDFEGDGGKKISVSGTLHAAGDPVFGKFDPKTKTFTEGKYVGQYDLENVETDNTGNGDDAGDNNGVESGGGTTPNPSGPEIGEGEDNLN